MQERQWGFLFLLLPIESVHQLQWNLGSNTVTVLGKSQQQFFGTVYTTISLILHFGSA